MSFRGLYTPKGLYIIAQGQRSATLGGGGTKAHTLKGLHKGRPNLMEGSKQPLCVWDIVCMGHCMYGIDSSIVDRPVRYRIPLCNPFRVWFFGALLPRVALR